MKKWIRAIRHPYKKLRPGIDFVCEQHFEEDCLSRFYETKMPDGTIHRIKRGRILLKSDAVPSIFPFSTRCLPIKKQNRKSPRKRNVRTKSPDIVDHVPVECTIDNHEMSFDDLKCKLKTLPLPSEQWFFSCVDNSLVLGKLNSDLDIGKKIVVTEDLTLKVMYS